MRVLLVSPIDPDVPASLKYLMGGENTYTRTLLAHPPPGVEYVHHVEALESGEVRKGGYYELLRLLTKFRLLPLSAGTVDIELVGDFDLVHCHAYTLRLSGKGKRRVPVVMGDSIPTHWSLSAYFYQHPLRIKSQYSFRRLIHNWLAVYDQDLFFGDFSKLIVMSEFAKREHIKIGGDEKRMAVVYPGLPDRGEKKKEKSSDVKILFAGVWFERKGGLLLWKAYSDLRKKYGKKLSLTVLGPFPLGHELSKSELQKLGVVQHDFVSYKRLIEEFYPKAGILVHVPPKAEGYGLVVTEAMSFGIPVVASRVGAIPELVIDGKTGVLVKPGSVSSLKKAMVRLIDDESLRERLGKGARKRFLELFSLNEMNEKLLGIYKEAIRNSNTSG